MWYELETDGDFLKRDNSSFGTNFYYTAANALLVRENATVALVNVSSGNNTAVNALTSSPTKRAAFITEMISFCETNNFDGVDLDLETFQVGSMSASQYIDWKTLVTELGNALHAEGLILSIEVPPIWNTAANSESGSGDAWDSANSQGYYRLVYADFNNLPVDKMVIMAYDYQYDYSAGEPNQPLKWFEEILRFARQNVNEQKVEIVAGIPAAGYSGATGGYSITGRTYDYLSIQTGFGGASRDADSGELIWANGGTSYAAIDDTAIALKVAQAEAVGIYKYALWHVGNNQYGGDALTYLHPDTHNMKSLSAPQVASLISIRF
jgi:spore germination protein YaaH